MAFKQTGINLLKLLLPPILVIACTSSHPQDKAGNVAEKKQSTIAFMPYAGFDTSHIAVLQDEAGNFYHCKTVVLKPSPLPFFAYYASRNRYKADSLLVFEKTLITQNINAIVGLTDKDISTSKGTIPDWGVFGLGFYPGKACVASTYRLSRASKTIQQLRERLVKVVLHELGHNFGLPHCGNNPVCLMSDAGGTIAQVDKEKKWLCENCAKQLRL